MGHLLWRRGFDRERPWWAGNAEDDEGNHVLFVMCPLFAFTWRYHAG